MRRSARNSSAGSDTRGFDELRQRGLFTKSSNEGNELIHDTKDIEWVTELLL